MDVWLSKRSLRGTGALLALMMVAGGLRARGQTSGTAASQGTVHKGPAEASAATTTDGVLVDQVIAVVNGELVLESDVQEEQRFAAFQPFTSLGAGFSRQTAVERLIDRTLILQQSRLQPDNGVSLDEARKQLDALRKEIPGCKQYGCETEAGWTKFVHDQGFTLDELTELWQQRMEILKFIETRFRAGIQISPGEIESYYKDKLLPAYAKRGATAPKLESITDRVQEILLQGQVSNLLGDWLLSLKAQGTVRIMRPGEVRS